MMIIAVLIAVVLTPVTGLAQETKLSAGSTNAVSFDVVLDGLSNPSGIAIQPNTGCVFVADSSAQRVVRVVEGKAEEVIVGFGGKATGDQAFSRNGPESLLFLNKDFLIVSSGSPDGIGVLGVYRVPQVGVEPVLADNPEFESHSLVGTDGTDTVARYYSLVRTVKGIFAICVGEKKGERTLVLATLDKDKLRRLSFAKTFDSYAEFGSPTAMTISPEGYLAIGQTAAQDQTAISQLTFCDVQDGKVLDAFENGMIEIAGLAYGPKNGRLFAIDAGSSDSSRGSLVKIVGANGACRCQTLIELEVPTAMAFASNGDLFVTVVGDVANYSGEPTGKLLVVKGLDRQPEKKY